MAAFTVTQGRYLSFILAYTDAYGLPPAESDIAFALKVSAPSVNQMVRTLEGKSLITRKPGVGRSIDIAIDPTEIPKWEGKMPPRTEKVWARSKVEADRFADAIIRARVVQRMQARNRRTDPSIEEIL
jgi:DNA-binding FadR family transcriptional regulator